MAATGIALPAERGFARLRSDAGSGPADSSRGTPVDAIEAAHARLVATFRTGRTKAYEWRMKQLQGLRRLTTENSDRVTDAITADLGRPKMEALLGDVAPVLAELDYVMQHLKAWMGPLAVPTPLTQRPGRSVVIREPKGVVLQIAPWNFPFNLSLMTLISGLAAGNCCVLKPSEIAPHTEQLLKKLLPLYVDADAVAVITGGVPEATALLKLRWDHIFYTGNGAVARIVSRAAAEHLTPVSLELGGKSPTVVLPGANIKVAAKRILSGKNFNAGQICIAPDYVVVHEQVEEQLVKEMQTTLKSWYGNDARMSDSFGRIVNKQHHRRVCQLIQSADGEVLQQGRSDEESKFIPPTLVRNPTMSSAIMTEEIFGPALPIIKKKCVQDIVEHINAGEKPLAMYIFAPEADADKIISQTSSGGVCVNDTIFHFTNPNLPFGGVGGSGMGRYHGKWGFDEFSHVRGVMYRGTWIDPHQRYPPYTDSNMRMMQKLLVGPLIPPAVTKAVAALGGLVLAVAASTAVRSRL